MNQHNTEQVQQEREQERLALLDNHHRQWLQHPGTQHLISVMDKGIDLTMKSLCSNSSIANPDKVESQKQNALLLSVQLNTLQTYKNIIINTELFKKAQR